MKSYFRLLLTGFFFVVLAGCAGQPNLPAQPAAGAGAGPSVLVESYRMGVGDQLRINVWKNPELSVDEPIRPDGKISMPLIGDVVAAGKEPEQLAEDIRTALLDYVRNPNVTVILVNLTGHEFLSRIRVTGSVNNNISIPYRQGMTVLDAVLEAGSVTLYADGNRTKLHRRAGGAAQSYDIRLKDMMEDGDMSTNILLMPGDVITVPERLF